MEHNAAAVSLEVLSDVIPANVCMIHIGREVDGVIGLIHVAACIVDTVALKNPCIRWCTRFTKYAGRAAKPRGWRWAREAVVDDAHVASFIVDGGVTTNNCQVCDGEVFPPAVNSICHRGTANIHRSARVAHDRKLFCRRTTTEV